MQLTQQGENAVGYEPQEKLRLAAMLIRGELEINQFVNGVCYDAAAFIKYLLSGNQLGGLGITEAQLRANSGQAWIPNLNSDTRWAYRSLISPGSVITFRRLTDNQIFHAAISIGMTSIRAVNGNLLGAGWRVSANLNTVLRMSPNYSAHENVFLYDNTDIVVQIQQNLTPVPLR